MAKAWIFGDPDYQAKCISEAKAEIERAAKKCSISPKAFLKLMLLYFQADASTYSLDVQQSLTGHRSQVGLEYLFALNPAWTPDKKDTDMFVSLLSR